MDVLECYTDGSWLGSTRTAGSGIVFPAHLEWNQSAPFLLDNPTNQRAELRAIGLAMDVAFEKMGPSVQLTVYSDSVYSMNCLTKWVPAWEKNGWLTSKGDAVLNQDLLRPMLQKMATFKTPPSFKYVRAHRGHQWTEMADALAKGAALSAAGVHKVK
jgi:ribonuclease HI